VGRFLTSATADAPLVGGVSLADVRAGIGMASMSTAPVLIEGETGTGKELVARAIHEATARTGELVGLNCAALPAELVEAELFGHTRGAFSGSVAGRAGLFRTAHKGTLLLDEIGELPPTSQAKLLRVIETNEVRPVGEDRATPVDVRLIAASNRDLGALTRSGAFRADLLHRIAVITIRMPPLRERLEDVPALCAYFLHGQRVDLDVHAMELLLGRSWPGNVRELKNVVTAAALRARQAGHDHIGAGDITPSLRDAEDDERSTRSTLIAALVDAGGNVTRAAQALGVARSGLYETLKRLGIDPAQFRRP
jgi:two-component system NtrC family response regulator